MRIGILGNPLIKIHKIILKVIYKVIFMEIPKGDSKDLSTVFIKFDRNSE